jgi:hypothetical protein
VECPLCSCPSNNCKTFCKGCWISPKRPDVQTWSSQCCNWEVVEPLRGGTLWEVLRSLRTYPSRRLCDPTLPFLLLLCLLCKCFCSIMCSCHDVLPCHRPIDHGLKLPKLWARINLFSL